MLAGAYELRYYRGEGTSNLVSRSAVIRAHWQFSSISISGQSFVLRNQDGVYTIQYVRSVAGGLIGGGEWALDPSLV